MDDREEMILCPECAGWFPAGGPDNVLIHLIAFHPGSDFAQRVMRELVLLPLPDEGVMPSNP